MQLELLKSREKLNWIQGEISRVPKYARSDEHAEETRFREDR